MLVATLKLACGKYLPYYPAHGPLAQGILMVWIIVSVLLRGCQCLPTLTFSIHPEDLTIEEGKDVQFVCQLESDVEVRLASSFWENRNREILYPQDFINITTQSVTGSITSTLVIKRVGRDIIDSYRCTLLLLLPHKRIEIISSEFGELNVLHFPEDGDLNCNTPTGVTVKAFDTITVSCEAAECNLPLDMTWEQSNMIGLHHTVLVQEPCSLTWRVTVDRKLHDELLYCVVTSSEFPGRRSSCSLGPFDVLYAPEVQVSPPHSEVLVPSLDTSTSLYCLLDSNPPVHTFQWSCSPDGLLPSCDSEEQNITIPLSEIGLRNFTVDVTCTATNAVGTSSSVSKFSLGSPLDGFGQDCSSQIRHDLSDIARGIYLFHFRTGDVYHFACASVDETGTVEAFRWYLDDRPIRENNNARSKQILPWLCSDILILTNNSLFAEDNHVVKCEVTTEASVKATSCTFNSRSGQSSTNIPQTTASGRASRLSSVSITTHQEETITNNDLQHRVTSKPTPGSSLNFWDIFWMLLIAVTVGFGLVLCSIALVLIVQRASRRGRMPFNRPSDTVQLTNLQRGIFPNPKSPGADEPVYELPRDCGSLRKASTKPLPPRPKHDVCELKKLHISEGDPEGSCSDEYSGVYEDSSQGDDNSGSLVSTSETSSGAQYQEYAECERNFGFVHYDNHQVVESFIGGRQSSYYWNKSAAFKETYEGNVKERAKMFASEGCLRNIQRIYLE